ncbi:MAG: hypothetical protein AB7V46_04410 [Thermomicrobiales bacterium]
MKRFALLIAVTLLGIGFVAPAFAQDATPATATPPFVTAPQLGVSEFDIVITDEGYDAPSSLPAGRYLVNVTNSTEAPAAAAFLMPPADWTLEQVQTALTPPADENAPPPDDTWLYRAPIAGGAGGLPGMTNQAVIVLGPGRWVIWGDDPGSPIPLAEVMVTGALPATIGALAASTVTITATSNAHGYDFAIEGDIVAGQQLVTFVNKTDQPHFVSSLITPVPLDDEMFMQLFMMEEGATPVPESGLPSPEEIMDNPSYITTISAGVTIWSVMDFPAGYHTLVCFVPELTSPEGLPHAAFGMIEHIEVS